MPERRSGTGGAVVGIGAGRGPNGPTPSGKIWAGYRQVLRRRNFTLLWMGQTVSWFGDSLYFVSLLWLVQELTGSRAMMGLVAACRTVPQLLQVLTGAFVDRWDRRRMMLYADLLRAAIVMSIPALKLLGLLQPWHIPTVAFLLASVGVFFFPARSALVPVLVDKDELTQANSLMTLSQQLIFVVGYAVAGLMIAMMGVIPMFTIDAATFLASVTAITLLRLTPEQAHPAKARALALATAVKAASGTASAAASGAASGAAEAGGKKAATLRQELVEGFRFIGRNRAMMAVMPLAIVLNFVAAPLGVLMPAWVKDVLKTGAGMFGFLETASTAGMALGAIGVGLLVTRFRRSALVLSGLILQGGSIIVLSVARGVPLPLASMALMGFVNSVVNVIFMTWVQTVVPREMMGRIFGTIGTVSNIAAPAGQALAGVLGEMMPLPLLFGGVGAVFALIGGVYAMIPMLRKAFDLMELETENGSRTAPVAAGGVETKAAATPGAQGPG